jgi:hypothetical protein
MELADLRYYHIEHSRFKEERGIELDATQARYVYGRLATRYKIKQRLDLTSGNPNRAGSGKCGEWRILLRLPTNIQSMAHEIAHAIDMKRMPRPKRWHTKRHARITERILKFLKPRIEEWKTIAQDKERGKEDTAERRRIRKLEQEQTKETPEYRIAKLKTQAERWLSKRTRAENAIRKIERRIRIWETKKQMRQADPNGAAEQVG